MSVLPEALRPWAAQLGACAPEFSLSLGSWVRKLSVALGPLPEISTGSEGEPDGFDGLTRRGDYQHLLASEWLLAEEVPDEFLRRAGSMEHAFLRRNFRTPMASRRCLVLFDCGPSQLGTPRLSHLVALVVLAQRAESAGGELVFAALQQAPDQVPFDRAGRGFSSEGLEQLMRARTYEEPTSQHLEAWRAELSLRPSEDDVWLVGGSRLARLPGADTFGRIEVEQVLWPNERKLKLSVVHPSRGRVELWLELPSDEQCVRLIRHPARPAPQAPSSPQPAPVGGKVPWPSSNLLFCWTQHRLFYLARDGSLVILPVPNSTIGGVGRAVRFVPPPGEQVIAAGWSKGVLAVTHRQVSHESCHLTVHFLNKRGGQRRTPLSFAGPLPPFMGSALLACRRLPHCQGDREQFLLAGPAMPLCVLEGEGHQFLPSVVAAADYPDRLVVACEGDTELLAYSPFVRRVKVPLFQPVPLQNETLLGFLGLLGTMHREGEWLLMTRESAVEVVQPPGGVVGVAPYFGRHGEPSLVVLTPDRQSVELHSPSEKRSVIHLASPIREVTVSQVSHQLAWVTESGELAVSSLLRHEAGQFYVHRQCEGAP